MRAGRYLWLNKHSLPYFLAFFVCSLLDLLRQMNRASRPDMGPYLYATPPGSFTHFHQDGHGTVDSGHLCIHGHNEVIVLRRVPECHKRNALGILLGGEATGSMTAESAMFHQPHQDGLVSPELTSIP